MSETICLNCTGVGQVSDTNGKVTCHVCDGEGFAPDPVNHPSHYQSEGGIESIDAIHAALGAEGFVSYCRGAAMKYTFRSGKKAAHAQDLRKAIWYLDRAAKVLEAQ